MKVRRGRAEKKEFYKLEFDWAPNRMTMPYFQGETPIAVREVKMELTDRYYQDGCFPWKKTFCILPRRSITGKRIFFEIAYIRRFYGVWDHGMHTEPHVEYATLFEVLTENA